MCQRAADARSRVALCFDLVDQLCPANHFPQGFLDAVIKGWETAYSDRSIALSSISAFDSASLSNDLIAWNLDQQARSIRPDGRRFCEITTAELQNMALLLTELGLLKSTIDIGDAFDPQFLNNHYK